MLTETRLFTAGEFRRRAERVDRLRAHPQEDGDHRFNPGHERLFQQLRLRDAAVLIPVVDRGSEATMLLTKRSETLRNHTGQVAFPGGRQDPGEDLWGTALREAAEEVALDGSGVELLGELDHLSTVSSDSFIAPYVAALPGRPELRPNPGEVDAVLHVPVRELLDHEREERWWFGDRYHPIVFFDLVGDTVWGATAAMLRQLLGIGTGTLGRGDLGHD